MNIVIIAEQMKSLGGTSIHIASCAKHLTRKGNEVYIVALGSINGCLDIGTAHFVSAGPLAEDLSQGQDMAIPLLNKLLEICSAYPVDVIHAHYQNAMFLSAVTKTIWGIPYVISFHGYELQLIMMNEFQYRSAKIGIENASYITSVSTALYDDVKSTFPQMETYPYEIVPDGVDVHFDKEEIARLKKLHRSEFTYIYIGRLSIDKGAWDLLTTFKRMPSSSKLVIIGKGQLENSIHSFIEEYNLSDRVIIYPEVPHLQIANYIASANVLVLPSHYEGLGTVILESFCSGIPVVGSRVGGIPEVIINGYNGLLFSPGNENELFAALKRISEDPILYEKCREGANISAKNFLWESIVQRYVNIYDRVRLETNSTYGEVKRKLSHNFNFQNGNPWQSTVSK